jgi:hypothetical protein
MIENAMRVEETAQRSKALKGSRAERATARATYVRSTT